MSLTYWALIENKLPLKEYLSWARDHFKIPSLNEEAHNMKLNIDLWQRVQSIPHWSCEMLPIAEWEGVTFIGCIDPDREIHWDFPIQYILASPHQLDYFWNRLSDIPLPEVMSQTLSNDSPKKTLTGGEETDGGKMKSVRVTHIKDSHPEKTTNNEDEKITVVTITNSFPKLNELADISAELEEVDNNQLNENTPIDIDLNDRKGDCMLPQKKANNSLEYPNKTKTEGSLKLPPPPHVNGNKSPTPNLQNNEHKKKANNSLEYPNKTKTEGSLKLPPPPHVNGNKSKTPNLHENEHKKKANNSLEYPNKTKTEGSLKLPLPPHVNGNKSPTPNLQNNEHKKMAAIIDSSAEIKTKAETELKLTDDPSELMKQPNTKEVKASDDNFPATDDNFPATDDNLPCYRDNFPATDLPCYRLTSLK